MKDTTISSIYDTSPTLIPGKSRRDFPFPYSPTGGPPDSPTGGPVLTHRWCPYFPPGVPYPPHHSHQYLLHVDNTCGVFVRTGGLLLTIGIPCTHDPWSPYSPPTKMFLAPAQSKKYFFLSKFQHQHCFYGHHHKTLTLFNNAHKQKS